MNLDEHLDLFIIFTYAKMQTSYNQTYPLTKNLLTASTQDQWKIIKNPVLLSIPSICQKL